MSIFSKIFAFEAKPLEKPSYYRADIDGLRAIAVIAVILFHAFPQWMPGGFIGVDIFFVISGYLISSIIFKKIESNSFSLVDFYCRRIRRLYPSLLIVLAFTLAYGWLISFPDEFKILGNSLFKGTLFIANFLFSKETNYFDLGAEKNPLLHLWSLCIEEQFYIVWPITLYFFRKNFRFVKILILIGLCVSFGLNILYVVKSPVRTFYLPYTRFWELFAGVALAYVNDKQYLKNFNIKLCSSIIRFGI